MDLSLLQVYKKIWHHVSQVRRLQLVGLIFLMILTSLFEALSLGALVPFIGILTSPEKITSISFITEIIPINLMLIDKSSIQFYITLIFTSCIFIAGSLRIALLYYQIKISHLLGVEFGVKVFSSILSMEYKDHTSSHTSELIVAVSKAQEIIPYLLQPTLIIISSLMMFFSIFFTLLLINKSITLTTVLIFITIYLLIIKIFKKNIQNNSTTLSRQSVKSMKVLSEGLGGIRDIILDRSHKYFISMFENSTFKVQKANANMQILNGSPRFILETFGIIIISLLAFFSLRQGSNMIDIIPTIGALALGAQKLLPLIQQIYSALTSILGNKSSISDAVKRFNRDPNAYYSKKIKLRALNFQTSIELKNISFRFSNEAPWILKNASLKIKKGSRIGIVGKTGGGKSTTLDLIMCLIKPQEGSITVDGKNINNGNQSGWHSMISHVPQAIFLSDASVRENIAFGVTPKDIDDELVVKCAADAKLSNVIKEMKNGYYSKIGERGVRLSGGQRQRLAIARALYKKSSVIIFDEATSALDNETEKQVMESVYSIDKSITIIIVAHRISTLKGCDQVYKIDNASISLVQKEI